MVGQQILSATRNFSEFSGGTLTYTVKKREKAKTPLQNAQPVHFSPPGAVLIAPGIRSLDAY